MTDMRATERLLEVLHQQTAELFGSRLADVGDEAADILAIIAELRRRGDTLVRRDDLVHLLDKDESIFGSEHEIRAQQDAFVEARTRLENAIGGKP